MPPDAVCGPCCGHMLPEVQDTWKQGIVYDYVKISQIRLYKIDQAAVGGLTEVVGTDEIFASIKQGDPTFFLNIAQLNQKTDPILPNLIAGGTTAGMAHGNTMYSGANRQVAQASKWGRLRYSVEPEQHDVVVWDEGTRTNKCDGMATSGNFGKDSSVNVKPAMKLGHINPWAVGTLYTNGTYSEIYNHHLVRNNLTNKAGYSDKADDKDIKTVEWTKFNERRRTKNIATVISDFLILQTSGGDQSIFYFDKSTAPTECQEHFQKMKATEDEMMTSNPKSIFNKKDGGCGDGNAYLKVSEHFINQGSYNGRFKQVGGGIPGKYKAYNQVSGKELAVNGDKIETFVDKDPAKTINRPNRNGLMLLMEDKIKIKPTAINTIYTPNESLVFYKQVVGYYSNDLDRLDVYGKQVAPLSNVLVGAEAQKAGPANLVKWGDRVGLQYPTSYSNETKDAINSVVLYTPVSTENAIILPLKDVDIKGKQVSRDQRVEGVEVLNLNDELNKFTRCSLDPATCEHRVLNCKFYEDKVLGEFDFEPTYNVTEKRVVGGKVEEVNVTKPNSYIESGKHIVTNKKTGIEYVLPSGFTLENNNTVGSGQYLSAKGIRWSIPFSDLGISGDKGERISVNMDIFVPTQGTNKPMVVSFEGYDFWINGLGNTYGVFDTGASTSADKQGTKHIQGGSLVGKKTKLELTFGFNNVVDCEAKIDEVVVPIKVTATKPTWQTDIIGNRMLVDSVVEITNPEELPDNLQRNQLGNNLNIGSWTKNDSYGANFYIDNLEIVRKGGTHTHNSSCYTNVKIHETTRQPKYKTVETSYYESCTGELNADYQLGCNNLPLNHYGLPSCGYAEGQPACGIAESGSGVYNMVASDDDSGGSLEARLSYTLTAGNSAKIQMGGYRGGGGTANLVVMHPNGTVIHGSGPQSYTGYFEGEGSYKYEFVVPVTGVYTFYTTNRTNDPYLGLYVRDGHRHVAGCLHHHTGVAGNTPNGCYATPTTHIHTGAFSSTTPNGCYTRPTKHVHTAMCGLVPAGTLVNSGEEEVTDLNHHKHTGQCVTTHTVIPTSTFGYTGNEQIYTVPEDGVYKVRAWGAAGGGVAAQTMGSHKGWGGYTEGRIHLKKGTRLYIYVGDEGKLSSSINTGGGWNGGGHGGPGGYGGGGATDIRLVSAEQGDEESLLSRVVVAGGGGGSDNATGENLGSADDGSGGAGGGIEGGGPRRDGVIVGGLGGSQDRGTWGQGQSVTQSDAGGGGGGYRGGATRSYGNEGGAGGSSYISGHTGVRSVDAEGNMTNSTVHYMGMKFSNTVVQQGINPGSGKVQIIPEQTLATNVFEDMMLGKYTEDQNREYLGSDLANELYPIPTLLQSWGNWSVGSMQGFRTHPGYNALSVSGGNLISAISLCNIEFSVPIDIPDARVIKEIRITLDNNTAVNTLGVFKNHLRDADVWVSQLPSTANQVVVVRPKWTGTVTSLQFDTSPGLFVGNTVVKKIEILGYGQRTRATSDNVSLLHTWNNWSTANDKGFTSNGHAVQSFVNGNYVQNISNIDPMAFVNVDFDAEAVKYIQVTLDNNTRSTQGTLFWTRQGEVHHRDRMANAPSNAYSSNQVLVFDVQNTPNWSGRIKNLRFDFADGPDPTGGNVVVKRIDVYGTGTKVGSGEASFTSTTVATAGQTWDFGYVGAERQFVSPGAGTYKLEVWGAQGGHTAYNPTNTGGLGGYSIGNLVLSAGQLLTVRVGGSPYSTVANTNGGGVNCAGGYNGGGSGTGAAGGGGGATDIRLAGQALNNRIIVAGGGGGGVDKLGGVGGGLNGGFGENFCGARGGGATQSTGYALGQGGDGLVRTSGDQGGGGGGYYGGYGAGNSEADPGGGGSGYVGGVTGGSTQAGVQSGNGLARITALTPITNTVSTFTPLSINYVDRFVSVRIEYRDPLSSKRQQILDNVHRIPEYLTNGQKNPIFICKGLPFNEHVCTDKCKVIKILNCTEPHHYGEHYDGSNRICWEACGDDSKHMIGNKPVEIKPGERVNAARFLQMEHGFTVYFPNRGNFAGNGALGLSTVQTPTGYGYYNNMDTTQWTREKRVKFPFNVLHKGQVYVADTWIDLEVPEEYFDFYVLLANEEQNNAMVEFEVESINCGVVGQETLNYRDILGTVYKDALQAFRTGLEPRFIQSLNNGFRTNRDAGEEQGYGEYFTWKRGEETKLTQKKDEMRRIIKEDFEGATGINERAKPLTTNDNYERENNVMRTSSMESLHGGYKMYYIDLLGRIGNFMIVDTEDYRFSNFFKLPKTNPDEWLVEGFVYKVADDIQRWYIGDEWDIKGTKASPETKWLNTFNTQKWAQGTPESGRDENSPNLVTGALTAEVNNIAQLKKEQLRYGYDIYTSISTIGSYQKGRVLVTPYWYALNLRTGTIQPLDVYISRDGIYEAVNLFGNSKNGESDKPVYKYTMNLDWTKESNRRNYFGQEKTETLRVAEFFKEEHYEYPGYEGTGDIPEKADFVYQGSTQYKVPAGKYNYMGDAQSLLLGPTHRTFIGSQESNGTSEEVAKWGLDKNPGRVIKSEYFSNAAQRWHYKVGVPSSSVFVLKGEEPSKKNIDLIMNPDYAIIATNTVVALGKTWELEYKQPWVTNVKVNGRVYDVSSAKLPPIVAVFASEQSATKDIAVTKTH